MATEVMNMNENWIYQSNKLIEASYTLTVMEQKLVRLLASLIKKDDVDFMEYKFRSKELIKLLNTSEGRFYRDIDELTDTLMSRIIKLKNEKDTEFNKYHFIEIAKYKNGVLTLKINPEMKPFYLNLDWYTKYQIKNIMQFKSTYSFRIYEMLKQYQRIGERTISVDELRFILGIGKKEYPKYANLKQRVITVALKEINEKTDIFVEFEEIKTVRMITELKFSIKSNKNAIDEVSVTLDREVPKNNFEGSEGQINAIKGIFKEKITNLDAKKIFDTAKGDINYIKEKYKIAEQEGNIKNIVAWILTALAQDYKAPVGKVKDSNFNNFEQRTYNFDKLERQLLGWEE